MFTNSGLVARQSFKKRIVHMRKLSIQTLPSSRSNQRPDVLGRQNIDLAFLIENAENIIIRKRAVRHVKRRLRGFVFSGIPHQDDTCSQT